MNNRARRTRRRHTGARSALSIALCLPLSACPAWRLITGGGPKPPALELYRLTVPESPLGDTIAAGAPLAGTLAVAPYVAPGLYGDRSIVFRIDESQYGAYPSREWAIPLAEQLGLLTERVVNRQPLSTEGALFDPPSRRAHAYVWRGTVRQFEEVNRGQEVLAVVELDAQLVRSVDDSVLWSGSAKRERTVRPATMTAIVKTLSDLADEVVTELAGNARLALARAGASTARVQD